MQVNSAAAVELLEKLDDCVFDAISGDDRALAEVIRLWPEVISAVGPEMLDESREQYLRYSLSIWESCLAEGLREPLAPWRRCKFSTCSSVARSQQTLTPARSSGLSV